MNVESLRKIFERKINNYTESQEWQGVIALKDIMIEFDEAVKEILEIVERRLKAWKTLI